MRNVRHWLDYLTPDDKRRLARAMWLVAERPTKRICQHFDRVLALCHWRWLKARGVMP
jgi:hypothetical protein